MRLGALLPPSDGTNPTHVIDHAKAFEAAGFDSVWSAQAIGRGFMMQDPFIALTAVAAVTERVEIGTAVLQLPLYNPTDVALKSFSLQQISNGRFILGVGAGSTESDFDVHGLSYKQRFSNFDQSFAALRQIFVDGSAGTGNLNPWKSVEGGPPIFYGSWGKNVARAGAEFDGWIASAMHRTPEECVSALEGYRAAGGKRAIVTTILVAPDEDLVALQDKLTLFAQAGFDDAVIMPLPGSAPFDELRSLLPSS